MHQPASQHYHDVKSKRDKYFNNPSRKITTVIAAVQSVLRSSQNRCRYWFFFEASSLQPPARLSPDRQTINCAHIFLQECVHIIVSSSFLLGLSSWYDMLKGSWFRIFSHWEENYFHFTRSENVFKDYMVISNIENTFSITSGKKSVWQLRHCGGVLSCCRCVERTPVKAAQTHKKCCTLTNTQLIYTQETSLWDSSRLDPNATHKTKLN